ncbi:helicase associated domain-containing protein [Streptomyces sp. NPDC048362]|uniref:helicase associated domain-containing protein n=1 Tax=Streptomyces sp. NPDC048362 TaxID=3365539 RepID=UPI00371E0136
MTTLTQWIEREGAHRPVPRGHAEEISVGGKTEPVVVQLGVWISNTRARRDRHTQEQRDALRELGVQWAEARLPDLGWPTYVRKQIA